MAKKPKIPSYLHHKPTGQGRVRIDGRDIYLGEYGSEKSLVQYGQIIAQHSAGLPLAKSAQGIDKPADQGPSVAELIVAFRAHATKHYLKNSKQTSEVCCYDSCLRILRQMYGFMPAKDFGPLALKAVRAAMVAGDPKAVDSKGQPKPRKPWARTNVNVMIGRVRRVFKHAVENEMIPVSVFTSLQTVSPLLSGRTEAHDNPRREAVEQDKIDSVRELVRPLVRDLIDLQLLTGARSGELLKLTPNMINQSQEVWKAVLTDHKTAHHGVKRVLHFGPLGKLILTKYLGDDADEPIFKMTRTGYCRSITRACEAAGIDRWTPHWLRHTFCTRVREQHGIEAAQSMAGHTTSEISDHYSSKMDKLATKTAAAVG